MDADYPTLSEVALPRIDGVQATPPLYGRPNWLAIPYSQGWAVVGHIEGFEYYLSVNPYRHGAEVDEAVAKRIANTLNAYPDLVGNLRMMCAAAKLVEVAKSKGLDAIADLREAAKMAVKVLPA